jgi:endonuclease/exonuclease/phosphatase family metal-dependent hydrolase
VIAALTVALAAPAIGARAQLPTALPMLLPDGVPLCGVEQPASGVAPAPDDGVLRIATFNVLHSETTEGDVSLGDRLPLLAGAISASGADVVGAQEVTRNLGFDAANEYPQRHGLVAQRLAAAIAARTGEAWSWCWSQSNPHVPLTPDIDVGGGNPLDRLAAANGNLPDPGDFSEGLAIITRHPITGSRFRRLLPRSYEAAACIDGNPLCPLDATFDSRQVLWARINTTSGPLDMFTTHLAHHLTALSDQTKLLQARQALAITQEWATADATPDVLVGDFNSVPDGAVHQALIAGGFIDTYRAAGGVECAPEGGPGCSGDPPPGSEVYTAASSRPMTERIDYVWARPTAGCILRVPASQQIGTAPAALADGRFLWPSDHLGFVSDLACGGA